MKFQFQLKGEHLNSNQWAYDNGYIEGDLQIYVHGAPFFSDPYINVVELSIQLGNWLDALRHGLVRDFVYESIDHDGPILLFTVEGEALSISSPWQLFELTEPMPLKVVETAVKLYIIQLNEKLHAIDYVEKLDRFISDDVSENTKAIVLFEQNDYDAAMELFKKLAQEQPSVQSLNNLAWMYLREEEDLDEAEKLLQQVLALQPQSAFPYMMLGEIALHKQQYEQAKGYLQQALTFTVTEQATFNLAMAHFQLGEFEKAAQTFARCIGDSGLTQLNEVVSWMYAGEHQKAKALLDGWNEDAYDYTGAIEIADVYVELGFYEEARVQFEKEWESYVISPEIVGRYAYTLIQLGDKESAQAIIQKRILQIKEEIVEEQQAEFDEHWTVTDQQERMAQLTEQIATLESLYDRLVTGEVPAFDYEMYPAGGCQLFGCMRHGNLEYRGDK